MKILHLTLKKKWYEDDNAFESTWDKILCGMNETQLYAARNQPWIKQAARLAWDAAYGTVMEKVKSHLHGTTA